MLSSDSSSARLRNPSEQTPCRHVVAAPELLGRSVDAGNRELTPEFVGNCSPSIFRFESEMFSD